MGRRAVAEPLGSRPGTCDHRPRHGAASGCVPGRAPHWAHRTRRRPRPSHRWRTHRRGRPHSARRGGTIRGDAVMTALHSIPRSVRWTVLLGLIGLALTVPFSAPDGSGMQWDEAVLGGVAARGGGGGGGGARPPPAAPPPWRGRAPPPPPPDLWGPGLPTPGVSSG